MFVGGHKPLPTLKPTRIFRPFECPQSMAHLCVPRGRNDISNEIHAELHSFQRSMVSPEDPQGPAMIHALGGFTLEL
ncbi:hypothetical protein CEXT_754281 [Caerostris extrusa]|uniref:Uncharacterized protein n=1 Tax=Caerostris extrusa TaxID=172846 RepID=A0AAV4XGR4_CAEEX|nr:hypothetical protein CEXT_754281 [Caerostris extrusa]